MRAQILAVVLAATVSTAAGGASLLAGGAAFAQAAPSLSGEWKGGYISSDGSDVNTFDVRLRQAGAALSGTVIEVNKFADPSKALFLTSTVAGSVRGADIEFIKTYDGSGGAAHSLRYVGRLEAGGRRIRGTYAAEGATGAFEMVR
jgi:hypothetical protein